MTIANDKREVDLLSVVKNFSDAMIYKSRANLPNPNVALFPIVLTRDTFEIPRAEAAILRTARVASEFRNIANPHHDQNIYQVFYALSKLTGDPKYRIEADRVLTAFLRHCQESRYGFFCWGEHLGWDLTQDAPGGFPVEKVGAAIHEFYRPWIFWQKSFEVAPDNCLRFAKALWRHQIHHAGPSLTFSRHAKIYADKPSEGTYEFPRHGGFYIATWAAAYRWSADPEMLEAIDALVTFYEDRRNPQTGVISHGTYLEYDRAGNGVEMVYSASNISLAVDLWDAAIMVPEPLKTRMRELARSIDRTILAMPHEPGPGGKGFVLYAHPDTLMPEEFWTLQDYLRRGLPANRIPYTGGWRSGYKGQHPHTWIMAGLTERYKQTADAGFKSLILACADTFVVSEPSFGPDPTGRPSDIEAGSIGSVILSLNVAYKISDDNTYLDRAEWLSRWAIEKFWTGGSPLPRASVNEDIYAAPSRSDTLVLALLQTWLLRNAPERESEMGLLATDRN